MKRYFILLVVLFLYVVASAKVYDFESNDLGWNEISNEKGDVLIKEGVLYIEGKAKGGQSYFDDFLSSTCYLPIDIKDSFEIKANVLVKKLKDDAGFGVIFNYRDEHNCEFFCITKKNVSYYRIEKGYLVGYRLDRIKFRENKNAEVSFLLKKSFDNVSLIVDDVLVLEIPYVDYRYRGFGFFTKGEQTVSFDNLETIIK